MKTIETDQGGRFNLSDGQFRALHAAAAVMSLVAIVLVFISAANYSVINSDDCLWMTDVRGEDTVLIVSTLVEGGTADKAGVKEGDRVLAINGNTLPNHPNVSGYAQQYLNTAPVNTDISYLVERDGEVIELTIQLERRYLFVQFIFPIFALLWLIIGTIVVMIRPRGKVQRLFFFTGATTICAFNFPVFLIGNEPMLIGIRILWQALGVFFFVLWAWFCSVFPIDQNLFRKRTLRVLFMAPAVAVMAVNIIGYIAALSGLASRETVVSFQYVTLAVQGIMALYFLVGVWLLFRGYRRLPNSIDRRPMRVILIGTVLATLALMYIVILLPSLTVTALLNPQSLLPVLLIVALPFSFGYAVFNYQVMDIRVVVKTTLVYTMTMGIIGGLYLAMAFGVGQVLGSLFGEELETTVMVISFIAFLMLFDPIKQQIHEGLVERFFPQLRDYSQQLAEYSQKVVETVGIPAVAELMAETLKGNIALKDACVVVETVDGDLRPVSSGFDDVVLDAQTAHALQQLLRQRHELIALETLQEPERSALEGLRERFPYLIGMYAQGRVIGALLIGHANDGGGISGSQMPFISGVATQGAAALEVARLYEQEIARQRYREELATARRIQESLLPAKMPDVEEISISATSRPAMAVGGDYYEVIELADGRLLVMIADVSGKGLPASLYMAELHGMVRIASAIQESPKAILALLNDHLTEVIEKGTFITATLLLFDTRRGIVSFARAGHTPIVRRSGATIDSLIPIGLPLGVRSRDLFTASLQEYTVECEPGETFILYSDGVSEAMNAKREEYGDDRLMELISSSVDTTADALSDTILESVEEFRGEAEQNDDITVVIVRIEKGVERGFEGEEEGMRKPVVS